jgi:hypothetical protein
MSDEKIQRRTYKNYKGVFITDEHLTFIESNNINFSALVRDAIDVKMTEKIPKTLTVAEIGLIIKKYAEEVMKRVDSGDIRLQDGRSVRKLEAQTQKSVEEEFSQDVLQFRNDLIAIVEKQSDRILLNRITIGETFGTFNETAYAIGGEYLIKAAQKRIETIEYHVNEASKPHRGWGLYSKSDFYRKYLKDPAFHAYDPYNDNGDFPDGFWASE